MPSGLQWLNPWQGLSALPRSIWVLFAATLINRMGTMALPFLVLYLTKERGFSSDLGALALTLYGAGALVGAPVVGRLSDKIGPVTMMKASLFLTCAALCLYPLARGLPAIIGTTMVWAFVAEAFRPASLAITTDLVPAEQRKAAFAVTRLAVNLGMSIGPALGGFLAQASFDALFLVDGATSFLAGLVLVLFPPRRRPDPGTTAPASPASGGSPLAGAALHDREYLYFLATVVPIAVVFFQHAGPMSLFMVRHLGLLESDYGLMFTINTILIVLLEVRVNLVTAGWSSRRTLVVGSLLTGLGFGGLAFAQGIVPIAGCVVLWTFGEMVLVPGLSAYAAALAPAERRGEYMGLYTMSWSVAYSIGPALGVAVLDRFGGLALWPAALAASILAALMMAKLGRAAV